MLGIEPRCLVVQRRSLVTIPSFVFLLSAQIFVAFLIKSRAQALIPQNPDKKYDPRGENRCGTLLEQSIQLSFFFLHVVFNNEGICWPNCRLRM